LAQEAAKWRWPITIIVACVAACQIILTYPGDITVKAAWDIRIFKGWELGRINGEISFTRAKPAAPESTSQE
jgi:hypothetical protein